MKSLYSTSENLRSMLQSFKNEKDLEYLKKIAYEALPQSEIIATHCNDIEDIVPDYLWRLPKYFDMLFIK